MPQKCSVPGCRSNYIPGSKHITVFRFPKPETRRRQWVRAIRRDFEPGQNCGVCILHFADRYVTTIDRVTRDDGTVLEVPRKIPKLDNDAVPTIFPSLPSYMSRKVPLKRKDPLQRERERERNIKRKKMPRRCVVPGCKSNYDSELKNTLTSVTTFSFPKDDARKEAWLQAIPRRNWNPTVHSAVCSKHFYDTDIIKVQKWKNSKGELQELLLDRPRLCDNAVPQIFENIPCLLTIKRPKRKSRNVKRQVTMQGHSEIPLSTVRLKLDACPSIFPNDTSSFMKSAQKRNEPLKYQQELEIKREPNESENYVEDQSQDINITNSEPDAVTVKTEDLIEFEYVDVKKIEEEQPKVFNNLWQGYINLPNEFWATNKILKGKKYIVITKYTITEAEIPLQEKQVLIHENLTLTYFVLNKAFNTHCMPVSVTSVEEIENGLVYFDSLLVSECLRTQ